MTVFHAGEACGLHRTLFVFGIPRRGGRLCRPFCPVVTGTAVDAATPQPCLRRHTFSGLSEKVCKKRRWKRIGLYRVATEKVRRRTLRPAHGNLSTNLYYSAACVVTTLPSGAVATQGDCKTRCRGNNRPSTNSPVVLNICVLLYMFAGADAHIGPLGTDEFAADFRETSVHHAGRCAPARGRPHP